MKIAKALLATLIYLIVLAGVYYVHVTYFRVNVVFYSAIADGVIASVLLAGLAWALPYFKVFNAFEKLQLVIIWLLTGYILAISVPAVIDRSLSFYILEKLQQRGGGIRLDAFEQVFTKEYVKEHRLVDVRLTEQYQSGTILIKDGCVTLTGKGERLATFSRYFRQHFLPKQRLLMGVYSDALTDPFRGSLATPEYTCHVDK